MACVGDHEISGPCPECNGTGWVDVHDSIRTEDDMPAVWENRGGRIHRPCEMPKWLGAYSELEWPASDHFDDEAA